MSSPPDQGHPPAAVVSLCADLTFNSKIVASARLAGIPCVTALSPRSLESRLSPHTQLLLVDLHQADLDARAVGQVVRHHAPQAQVVGHFSHVHADVGRAARDLGWQALPRSQFVLELDGLLRGLRI